MDFHELPIEVIDSIRASDAWYEIVLRRTTKRKGRMKDFESWESFLAREAGVDVGELLRKLEYIERALRERNPT
ncbi:MAG: hypothetical protein KAW39_03150 [Thermoplasmata archaeon]|nr:hypothetical protein [Thermoplasmata archaeon]